MDLEDIFNDFEAKDDCLRSDFICSLKFRLVYDDEIKNFPKENEYSSKIMTYFRTKKIPIDGKREYSSFENSMNARINKESIKDIFYAMHESSYGRVMPRAIPFEIVRAFSDQKDWGKWSSLYLFDGIRENYSSKKISYCDNTLYGLVREFILNGIKDIKKKNKQYSSSKIDLPFEKAIKSYLHIPRTQVKQCSGEIVMNSEVPQQIDFNTQKEVDIYSDFNQAKTFGGNNDSGPGTTFFM